MKRISSILTIIVCAAFFGTLAYTIYYIFETDYREISLGKLGAMAIILIFTYVLVIADSDSRKISSKDKFQYHDKYEKQIEKNKQAQQQEAQRRRIDELERDNLRIMKEREVDWEKFERYAEQIKRSARAEAAKEFSSKQRGGFFTDCADDWEKIQTRYKALSKAYHPDMAAGNAEVFQNINAEYEELREKYAPKQREYR